MCSNAEMARKEGGPTSERDGVHNAETSPRTRSLRYELPDGSWAYENDLGSNYIRTCEGNWR